MLITFKLYNITLFIDVNLYFDQYTFHTVGSFLDSINPIPSQPCIFICIDPFFLFYILILVQCLFGFSVLFYSNYGISNWSCNLPKHGTICLSLIWIVDNTVKIWCESLTEWEDTESFSIKTGMSTIPVFVLMGFYNWNEWPLSAHVQIVFTNWLISLMQFCNVVLFLWTFVYSTDLVLKVKFIEHDNDRTSPVIHHSPDITGGMREGHLGC